MSKRFFAIILTVVMLMAMVPPVFAADEPNGVPEGAKQFEITGNVKSPSGNTGLESIWIDGNDVYIIIYYHGPHNGLDMPYPTFNGVDMDTTIGTGTFPDSYPSNPMAAGKNYLVLAFYGVTLQQEGNELNGVKINGGGNNLENTIFLNIPKLSQIKFVIDPDKGTTENQTEFNGLVDGSAAEVKKPVVVANVGWKFTGWHSDSDELPETFPEGGLTFAAQFTPNEDTEYIVEHYKVVDGVETLADTETMEGTTDTEVTATSKTYAGYTLNPNYEGTVTSGTINGDGSTVLKLYYVANETKYIVEHYKVVDGVETLADTETMEGTTDTEVTATSKTYAGYTLNPNYEGTVASGMINGDGSTVLKLYYVAEDTRDPAPVLESTKLSNDSDTRIPGDIVTYTFTVKNSGDAPAYNVNITDEIPDGLTYTANSVTVNGRKGNYTIIDGVLTVELGIVPAGQEVIVVFKARVNDDAFGMVIFNVATISGTTKEGDEKPDLVKEIVDEKGVEVVPQLREDHIAYIIGYPDGTVQPEGNIKRSETVTIIFRLLDEPSRNYFYTNKNDFTDVDSTAWYNNALSTMVNAGTVTGYEDGTFLGDNYITRAEFAALMAKFDSHSYTGEDKFNDISDHWATGYINQAAARGWVKGYKDGSFRPDEYITRAEAMELVNNVLERSSISIAEMHRDMTTWSDNTDTDIWYYTVVQEATNSHEYTRDADGKAHWTSVLAPPDWAALEKSWAERG